MCRISEMLGKLLHSSIRISECDVVPGIHIDLIQQRRSEIWRQDRVLYHFGIDTIHKLFCGVALDNDAIVSNEFLNISSQIILFALVYQCPGVILGNVLLGSRNDIPQISLKHTGQPFPQSDSYRHHTLDLRNGNTVFPPASGSSPPHCTA